MKRTRLVAAMMTVAAVLAFLAIHAVVAPEPVGASECCQNCDAKEAACYDSCADAAHGLAEDDTLQSCYDNCFEDLYTQSYSCFAHCSYCSTPPNPSVCYTFVMEHQYECVWYDFDPPFECMEWQLIPNASGHVFAAYQTGNEWCTN